MIRDACPCRTLHDLRGSLSQLPQELYPVPFTGADARCRPFSHTVGRQYGCLLERRREKSGEYKLMGLAPYGEPKYADVIRDRLLDLREDGSFHLWK